MTKHFTMTIIGNIHDEAKVLEAGQATLVAQGIPSADLADLTIENAVRVMLDSATAPLDAGFEITDSCCEVEEGPDASPSEAGEKLRFYHHGRGCVCDGSLEHHVIDRESGETVNIYPSAYGAEAAAAEMNKASRDPFEGAEGTPWHTWCIEVADILGVEPGEVERLDPDAYSMFNTLVPPAVYAAQVSAGLTDSA